MLKSGSTSNHFPACTINEVLPDIHVAQRMMSFHVHCVHIKVISKCIPYIKEYTFNFWKILELNFHKCTIFKQTVYGKNSSEVKVLLTLAISFFFLYDEL